MGNFSYQCKSSGKPAMNNFNSGVGSAVYMFLLKGGKVVEKMFGNYGGYGKVNGCEWTMDWSDICDLHFNNNRDDGIALYLAENYTDQIPKTASADDPHQGDKKNGKGIKVKSPYHTVFAEFESGAEIKSKEVKKMIIENFIDHIETDGNLRKKMKAGVDLYIKEDHVNEILQSYPRLEE